MPDITCLQRKMLTIPSSSKNKQELLPTSVNEPQISRKNLGFCCFEGRFIWAQGFKGHCFGPTTSLNIMEMHTNNAGSPNRS